jgi:AraC-like DNA-binding protein
MLTLANLDKLCSARERLLRDEAPESVAALAAGAGLTTSHFITLFRSVFGETPQQCRIRGRLQRAQRLLALTDESVTQICLEVGFSSLGSFSDRFSRAFGVSPSGYRRKAQIHVRWTPGKPAALPFELVPPCIWLMNAAWAAQAPIAISEKQGGANGSTIAAFHP